MLDTPFFSSFAKRLEENCFYGNYKSNGSLHGENLRLVSRRVVFIQEHWVCEPFGDRCYLKVKVKQFSESENGPRMADLSAFTRMFSDSSKWRAFVRVMHIFIKCDPKMPESWYRNRDEFGGSP